jgi:hypothetical protein
MQPCMSHLVSSVVPLQIPLNQIALNKQMLRLPLSTPNKEDIGYKVASAALLDDSGSLQGLWPVQSIQLLDFSLPSKRLEAANHY